MECPVCLDAFPLPYAVTTSCGHSFCGTCVAQLAAQVRPQAIDCPVCREKISFLLPSFLLRGGEAEGEDPTAQLREYNAQHSEEAGVRDVARQVAPGFFQRSAGFKLAVLLPGLLLLAYLVAPVDLVPDSVPVVGYLDDLVGVVFAGWFLFVLLERERTRLMRRI